MTDPQSNNPLARRWADRRRPPDYTQRSIKTRIFLMLALLMLVLAAAERSRDPKTWKWLSDLDKWDQSQEQPSTRLTPQPLRTAGGEVDTFVSSPDESNPPPEAKPTESATGSSPVAGQDPIERAWQQGWKEVIARIDGQQRTLLFEVLYAAEHQQTLPSDRRTAAAQMLAEANRLWEDYQAAAFQSLVALPQQDQGQWIDVLRQVNKRWSADVMPSIQAPIDGRAPTGNEALLLAGFQKTLDALVLARVEDNTLFLRPDEREAWLRLEGRVRDADPAALRRESVGQVGYLQLHKQPGDYRGQTVTIRGTVKNAYRTTASRSYLGVNNHYVLWIMPDGGPTAPVVVYALGLPAGFPPIEPSRDGSMTKLHEEVRVTGFFLKRGAYLGKDGTRTAPLIIANIPEWKPRELSLDRTTRFGLGLWWLWPAAGVALVAAIVLVGIGWWFTIRKPGDSQARASTPPDLTGITIGPSASEALRQMEQQQR